MNEHVSCPALFIAAPASGQGKTMMTAALARLHARRGRKVRVFKCGPDFIDPQVHAVASGAPVYNVDLGMCGEYDAAWRFYSAAQEADLLLVEGVMGLYDGQPSGADLACRFGIPVMAVIDAQAMAQTFAAVAHGLASFRSGLPFAGVLANRVGGERHAHLLRDALPEGMSWFGAVMRHDDVSLPERHLGLVQASEIEDLEKRLDTLADDLERTRVADLPPAISFSRCLPPDIPPLLAGRAIAVARDAAYSFIYPANVDVLRALGADLRFFSPLAGDAIPPCDAIWLPGGYPELHAASLSDNRTFLEGLRHHVEAGKPMLAECGGMIGLFETLIDKEGTSHSFAGLLPGRIVMQQHLAALGLQRLSLPEGELTGHTFHYSRSECPLEPLTSTRTPNGGSGEAVYRMERLTASYTHCYFPSSPQAVALLLGPQ